MNEQINKNCIRHSPPSSSPYPRFFGLFERRLYFFFSMFHRHGRSASSEVVVIFFSVGGRASVGRHRPPSRCSVSESRCIIVCVHIFSIFIYFNDFSINFVEHNEKSCEFSKLILQSCFNEILSVFTHLSGLNNNVLYLLLPRY